MSRQIKSIKIEKLTRHIAQTHFPNRPVIRFGCGFLYRFSYMVEYFSLPVNETFEGYMNQIKILYIKILNSIGSYLSVIYHSFHCKCSVHCRQISTKWFVWLFPINFRECEIVRNFPHLSAPFFYEVHNEINVRIGNSSTAHLTWRDNNRLLCIYCQIVTSNTKSIAQNSGNFSNRL